jgi:hypothetical protein
LKPVYYGGNELPMLVVGIIAAVLLAVGLLPPYGELWKRRGRVVGINWVRAVGQAFARRDAEYPRSFSLWIGSAPVFPSWRWVSVSGFVSDS